MESNAPPVVDANVWGLIGLKKGNKRKQQKALNDLRRDTKVLDLVDDIHNEKHKRRIAFRGVKRQLSLWKGPVLKNRLADQLIFPLNDTAVTLANSEESEFVRSKEHISASRSESGSLQGKLYNAIYRNGDDTIKPSVHDKVFTEVRKRLLEKLEQREKERFLLTRFAARNKRQNKIKSKSFHRHQKGRLLKEYEKEMENMRKNNPRAFAEHIMKAEINRVKERASLRHRGGSKFSRLQKLRAKYDTEARDAVSEMHERSRELTKKNNLDDSSESEDSTVDVTSESESDSDGSLFAGSNSAESENEDLSRKLFWWHSSDTVADGGDKPVTHVNQTTFLSTLAAENTLEQCAPNHPTSSVADKLKQDEPEDDILDLTSDGFFRTLEETCATDPGLQDQFAEEKMKAIEEETPKDLDTFLPGWNAWTGPGLEEADEEQRKKHIIPAPKVRRMDSAKPHVLIRRRVNKEFKQHLVKSIPFPYNTPEQFEAVIAQPISREWTTESVHRELTRPKVTVQCGRIIRPISKSVALLRDKDVERLTKQKKDV